MAETERLQLLIDATAEGLRRELKGAEAAAEKFRRNSEQHFQRVDRSMRAVDDAAGLLKKGLGALGVALSVNAISSFTKSTIASTDALVKSADAMGLTIEKLQELRFGASRSGVSVEALDKSMEQWVRRLGQAQAGTGSLLPVIQQYNIALRDTDGQLRSTEAVLNDYADAIAGAVSPQERMRLATEAFGRSGGPMVVMLRNGSAGLADLAKQANDAGVVLSGNLARNAEALNDRIGVLSERADVASATLVLSLTPAIEGVLEVYERFSIGTANLINQFAEINNLGLGALEQRADGLREKIKLLEQTNPDDWFGTLSGARADLAAVEAQIDSIRTGGIAPTAGGGTVVDGLFPPETFKRVDDNLDQIRQQIYAATGALERFGSGGRDALSAFEAQTDLLERAEGMADAYNRSNKAAIETGQAMARTGSDYLPLLEELTALEERRADALRLDEIVADLGEQERFARTRVALGEEEAEIQRTLNQHRADGLEISEDLERRIRTSVAETAKLNKQWDASREKIKAAEKPPPMWPQTAACSRPISPTLTT